MSKENALFQQVKDNIAFDTLWPQVTETITTYSGKLWTDTGDHDPGVTLLQAVTWNTSDLSYRASLSVNDLLTQQGEPNLFPIDFGPQNVLTCNAVTAEDYRRLLRSLTLSDLHWYNPSDPFLFTEARIVREPEDNRFQWWYDTEKRHYVFSEPQGSDDNKKQMFLRGNNWLYLVPSSYLENYFPQYPHDRSLYEERLKNFLRDYRNLGEDFSRIIWLRPIAFYPQLTIELAEEVNDVNLIVAEIYETLNALTLPEVKHHTTAQLQKAGYSNEAIFEGPYLHNGWQTDSAPIITDSGITINLSQLFNRLLAINGVASISQFSAGTLSAHITAVSDDAWSWQVASGYYPQLWGTAPVTLLASDSSPLTLIAKGGIYQRPDEKKVKAYLQVPEHIKTEPVVLPAGKLRDLAAYTPVGDRLPECYQLQQPVAVINDTIRELHQFLLPVDQQLADGCAELATLPQLLAFTDRDKLNAIRGTRWPYATDSVSQQVHQQYAQALTGFQQQDTAVFADMANLSRELDFIQYLLGYFGAHRAARPLTINLADFLATQRALLAQQPTLGYDRINIRIDQVSALQKRIAARIGLNSECFAENPDLGKLPFYVVEHRQLLPLLPNDAYTEEQTPTDFISINKLVVTITQAGSAGKIVQGQLIDLIAYEGDSKLYVKQQLVTSTDGDSFTLNTANSLQLQNDLDRLQAAWNGKYKGNLRWQNSNIWLQDMDYRLNYATTQPTDSNQRVLASNDQSPYPTMVAAGDTITIRPAGLMPTIPDGLATAKAASVRADDWQLEATIVALNEVDGTLTVEKAAGSTNAFPKAEDAFRYQWNFSKAAYATADRFSFVVSIVHNRSMIEAGNIDPQRLIDWMQREVMAEFPAHVSIINLWLSDSAFKNFAATYKRWQNNGTPLGDDAFAIMQMLTLGHLPVTQLGIGLMRIATDEQKAAVVGEEGTGWDTSVILDQELFYVPQDLPSTL
ncbi:hypothetical protein [Enterobacter asburiae]|uniref:hypothetical protein n=1 Tax=Enterobacter asburiae TaxID=61645 RepID=UPI0011D186E8|nr:hypothetical protein [Enterobacter asburiae]